MKKTILTLALAVASAGTSFAYDGQFGFGIELTGTGTAATNNGVTTLYALDQGDDAALAATGSTATVSNAWTGASTAASPTFDLGTFSVGDSLILNGGSYLTYQGGGDVVSDASLNYAITGVTGFSSINLPLDLQNFDNPGNKRFATEGAAINLLAGLAPGTYSLNLYGMADATGGALYESNNSADFGASFTILGAAVPEPGSVSLLMLGVGGLFLIQRRLARSRLS